MQAVCYSKSTQTGSLTLLKPDSNNTLHFTLPGTMPADYQMALNLDFGTLSCMTLREGRPYLVAQQQFTGSELSVLLPLLESFPHYCPYEELFAHFYNGEVNAKIIDRSRTQLEHALMRGTWEQEMKPVRNVLSRTRIKLRTFGVNILSILETGCIITLSGKNMHSLRHPKYLVGDAVANF